jgi:S-adenosylmethionine:tRNA ribosyltransferase-isomerase
VTALKGLLDFVLPPELEASGPPEERGLRRDGVRLMVAHKQNGAIEHRSFSDLPGAVEPGDVLAVNTSATLPAALDATTFGGRPGSICRPGSRRTSG